MSRSESRTFQLNSGHARYPEVAQIIDYISVFQPQGFKNGGHGLPSLCNLIFLALRYKRIEVIFNQVGRREF